MNVAFGLMLLLIDLSAGMPGWWTAFEGPGLVTLGVVVLFLSRVAGAPAPIARSREPADRDDTLFLC
jgi:hypothetical protein